VRLPTNADVDLELRWDGSFGSLFDEEAHGSCIIHETVKRIAKELKDETVKLEHCLRKFIEPETLDRDNTWLVQG
jgi:hypothetical protein